ncbi:MAG: hypothetical protein N4A47_06690 [Clostridia bacterium]|jgi:flagellar basal-body rod modification protein FlgD|nr:hypothetical protein [Clostridia bacterium]
MADAVTNAYDGLDPTIKYDNAKGAPAKSGDNLDKNAFLNLLVTQMKYQDPMNPTEDKEFLAQMAQFTSLEQMENLSKTASITQGYDLIGKNVSATYMDDITKETRQVIGVVDGVKIKSGNVFLSVEGKDVPIEKVSIVDDSSSRRDELIKDVMSASGMLGKTIKWDKYDSDTGDTEELAGVAEEINIKDNKVYLIVKDENELVNHVSIDIVKGYHNKLEESIDVLNAQNIQAIRNKITAEETSEGGNEENNEEKETEDKVESE